MRVRKFCLQRFHETGKHPALAESLSFLKRA